MYEIGKVDFYSSSLCDLEEYERKKERKKIE
jgi:hypothetical protein